MRLSVLPALFFTWLVCALPGFAETVPAKVVANVPYKTGESLSEYEQTRCKLDLYLPTGEGKHPALVWFHGGGLTGGNKEGNTAQIAQRLASDGIAVATVNYRLSPQAKYPSYVQDAAAAFAWVKAHAAENGIDPARIFIGGHSAGAYLTSMVGLDPRWLAPHHLTPADVAGLIPVSGQMMTHFTVRAERGITDQNVITADEAAPIHHLHKDTPPILIIYADKDWPARREENLYFIALLKSMGNTKVQSIQIDDRTHGAVGNNIAKAGDPAQAAILSFIKDPLKAVK